MKNEKQRKNNLFLFLLLGAVLSLFPICLAKAENWYLCPTSGADNCNATHGCLCGSVSHKGNSYWYGADQGSATNTRVWHHKKVGHFNLCGAEAYYFDDCAGFCGGDGCPQWILDTALSSAKNTHEKK